MTRTTRIVHSLDHSFTAPILRPKTFRSSSGPSMRPRRSRRDALILRAPRDLARARPPRRPGGFTFVIPPILESIFSKAAPGLLSPNMIAMLRRPSAGKRIERFGATILGAVAAGLGLGARGSVRALARLTNANANGTDNRARSAGEGRRARSRQGQ